MARLFIGEVGERLAGGSAHDGSSPSLPATPQGAINFSMDEKKDRRNEYDDEPVYYCKRCLSLRIMTMKGCGDYCDRCGGVCVGTASIQDYERMKARRIEQINKGQYGN